MSLLLRFPFSFFFFFTIIVTAHRRENRIDEKFDRNGLDKRGMGYEPWKRNGTERNRILSSKHAFQKWQSRHVESSFRSGFQRSKIEGATYQVPLFLKERIREQVLKRHTSVPLPMVRGLPGTWAELVEKRRIIERERRGHEIPLFAFLLVLLLEPSYLEKQCAGQFLFGE